MNSKTYIINSLIRQIAHKTKPFDWVDMIWSDYGGRGFTKYISLSTKDFTIYLNESCDVKLLLHPTEIVLTNNEKEYILRAARHLCRRWHTNNRIVSESKKND